MQLNQMADIIVPLAFIKPMSRMTSSSQSPSAYRQRRSFLEICWLTVTGLRLVQHNTKSCFICLTSLTALAHPKPNLCVCKSIKGR